MTRSPQGGVSLLFLGLSIFHKDLKVLKQPKASSWNPSFTKKQIICLPVAPLLEEGSSQCRLRRVKKPLEMEILIEFPGLDEAFLKRGTGRDSWPVETQ